MEEYDKRGVYAILYRGHIIYIGQTKDSFLHRWGQHIANAFDPNHKGQKELYEFIKKHRGQIEFKMLISLEDIARMNATLDGAENILIAVYSPIFNQISVIFDKNANKKYDIDKLQDGLMKDYKGKIPPWLVHAFRYC